MRRLLGIFQVRLQSPRLPSQGLDLTPGVGRLIFGTAVVDDNICSGSRAGYSPRATNAPRGARYQDESIV